MVRHWPTLKTRELIPDPTLGGAIATVRDDQVFFVGFRRQKPDNIPELFRFDTSSGELTQLTKSPWEDWRPAIAPNGTIYFIANAKGDFDIYRLPPKSNQPTMFNRSDADEWDPAISPDGQWIEFASKRSGDWDVYISPTNNSAEVQRVTDLPGQEWEPAWYPSGTILAFASKQTEESQIRRDPQTVSRSC
jgi:Tol biopolymer transport system component